VAVAIDARSEASLGDVPSMISTLRSFGNDVRVLFLTASEPSWCSASRKPGGATRFVAGGSRASETTVGEAIAMDGSCWRR